MPRPDDDPKKWSPRQLQPPFLVVAAPEDSPLTPDDLIIEPAWTPEHIAEAWDQHDGRTAGTMVVGVYKFDPAQNIYKRDNSFGMLGDRRKTGPADPDDETNHL